MRNTLDNRSFPMALILVDILVLTIEDIKEWEVNLDKDMEVSPICLPIFLDLRFKTSCTTCTTRPFVFPSVRKNVSSFSSFSFTLSNPPSRPVIYSLLYLHFTPLHTLYTLLNPTHTMLQHLRPLPPCNLLYPPLHPFYILSPLFHHRYTHLHFFTPRYIPVTPC